MRLTIILTLLLSLATFVGCGGSNKNPYGAVYLEGTVTLDGSPMEGISVTLVPRDGDLSAGGITDAAGKFTVTTGGSAAGTGAKPGEYDVTFYKVELTGQGLSYEEYQKQFGDKQPETVYLVPKKYESAKTSEIPPITVSSNKADNKFDFALSSD